MPEFILNYGGGEMADKFARLDSFTQGYIEAMFFTSTGIGDDLEDASVAELAPHTWTQIITDCKDFQDSFGDDIQEACDQDKSDYNWERAGNDFWYTRNHHGVGFWDRGLGEIGDKLTKMAHPYGECTLYRGDDGLLYIT